MEPHHTYLRTQQNILYFCYLPHPGTHSYRCLIGASKTKLDRFKRYSIFATGFIEATT